MKGDFENLLKRVELILFWFSKAGLKFQKEKQNKTIQKSNNQTSKSITRDNKMISENSNIRSVFEPVIEATEPKARASGGSFSIVGGFRLGAGRCQWSGVGTKQSNWAE